MSQPNSLLRHNLSNLVSGEARVGWFDLRGVDAFCEAFHGILYLAGKGMRAGYRLRLAVGCWLSLFVWALSRWFAPSLGCEV